jgi:hypothetical protein
MSRCPSCDYPLPADRERLGARCPNCRDPLYEPPGRVGRAARDGEGSCAAHAGVETVGVCARCGNYLCEVCRTPWRGQIVCGACVQRALETKEAAPEAARQSFVQALLSVCFGVGGWVLTLAAVVIWVVAVGIAVAGGGNSANAGAVVGAGLLILLGCAVLAAAEALAVFGVGSAVSVLRVRGGSMILAVIGLLVNCLHLGALVGLFTMSLWQS